MWKAEYEEERATAQAAAAQAGQVLPLEDAPHVARPAPPPHPPHPPPQAATQAGTGPKPPPHPPPQAATQAAPAGSTQATQAAPTEAKAKAPGFVLVEGQMRPVSSVPASSSDNGPASSSDHGPVTCNAAVISELQWKLYEVQIQARTLLENIDSLQEGIARLRVDAGEASA